MSITIKSESNESTDYDYSGPAIEERNEIDHEEFLRAAARVSKQREMGPNDAMHKAIHVRHAAVREDMCLEEITRVLHNAYDYARESPHLRTAAIEADLQALYIVKNYVGDSAL